MKKMENKLKDSQVSSEFNNDQNHIDKNYHVTKSKMTVINNQSNEIKIAVSKSENSVSYPVQTDKTKLLRTTYVSRPDLSHSVLKRSNLTSSITNQIKQIHSFSHPKEDKSYKSSHRLEPPPPPPSALLFGTEDKDYRTVISTKNMDLGERTLKESAYSKSAHDVDMRVNTFSSSYFNFPVEKLNDVDWQRIPADNQEFVLNVPKNSYETAKDVMSHRNYSKESSDWKRHLPSSHPVPFPLSECCSSVLTSNNAPLPPPEFSKLADFPSNQPFNRLQCVTKPRLIPPPLPPFLGSIPNTSNLTASFATTTTSLLPVPMQKNSLMTSVQTACLQVAAAFSLSAPTPMPKLSCPAPLPSLSGSMPGPVQLPSLSHSGQMSILPHDPQIPAITSSVQVPNLSAPVKTPSLSGSMQLPGLSGSVQMPVLSGFGQRTTLSVVPTAVNVGVMLQEFITAGVISKKSGASIPSPTTTASSTEFGNNTEVKKKEILENEPISEILFEPKRLKRYHLDVINALHNGSQCATCGRRFKEIQREQYRRHLDWHFRMNRKQRDSTKKPFSRRLYYELKDWIEFKECEEVDEIVPAPCFFELQAGSEQSDQAVIECACSVPSTGCKSEMCAMCNEQFQLFWAEKEEEWHLRNAIKHDGQVFHPACYEDFQKGCKSVTTDLDTSSKEPSVCIKTESEKMEDQGIQFFTDSDFSSNSFPRNIGKLLEERSESVKNRPVKEEPMEISASKVENTKIVERREI